MAISHVVILGAGPAGLSAALSLSRLATAQESRPQSTSTPPPPVLCITVLELRPQVATLGGSINLTPLALRYLDRLGVAARLRPRGIPVRAIEMVSLRTGRLLGRLWPDVDAVRARRHDLVTSMLETARSGEHAQRITVRYGAKVVALREEGSAGADGGRVVLTLEGGEEIAADVVVGCDGLHSIARRLYVEPERKEVYSGKAVGYGFVPVEEAGKTPMVRADGKPALLDTTLITSRYGSLMTSFCTPERDHVHIAAVMALEEAEGEEGSRDGWRVRGEDKARVRGDIVTKFRDGKLAGVKELIGQVEDWSLFPVYILPREGKWTKGRVILLGDAAHAMPPQGESTGVAIEDGVLLAHVLQRHETRSISQMFADYETLRRKAIDDLWKESDWRWQGAARGDAGWLGAIIMEWATAAMVTLMLMNIQSKDHFSSDVERLKLPD